ncbi:hypothetical protein [Humibacter ginsenosidimutans]|uniref:Uncharacterized protein n=1 Tax=Humibacter ginsenosidimutans TaxID=2599293 RepID=A0A5B8M850_9MICO|nr:hypothetical protein [Humibacter ginsenosidimutans]QDZ15772.1 hypothetical protein FPZ11_14280 [Humibacter ginsenosidimutans]
MGAQAWPFNVDGTGTAPAWSARQLRQLAVAPFVAVGTKARPLGAKSGIRVGTPSSIVSVTGSGPYSWSVAPFAGVIDGESNAAAGPYTYSFDSTQTGSIGTAGAAARQDRLDVVISDTDEGDGSGTRSIAVVYTQGAATGGALPAAPARSHRLATISVPTSGAPTIIWAPDWAAWVFTTYADMTAYTTLIGAANVPVTRAEVIADTTAANNGIYAWSGTAWLPVALTSPPFFTYYRTASFSWTTTAADFKWDTLSKGSLAGFTTSDGITFTCTIPGVYELVGSIGKASASGVTGQYIDIFYNGTADRRFEGPAFTSTNTQADFNYSQRFAVGDTFKLQIKSGGGTGGGFPADGTVQVTALTVHYRHA